MAAGLRPLWIGDREGLRVFAAATAAAAILLPIVVGLPLGLSAATGDVWRAMPLSYAVAVPLALIAWPRALRPAAAARLRLGGRAILQGVIAAIVLYGLGAAVLVVAQAIAPTLAAQLVQIYGLAAAAPGLWAIPLLIVTIVGEELIWRGLILWPLAARVGPWPALVIAALLYAGAHALVGPPLLAAAALGVGIFWGWLSLRSESLMAAIVSHLLWDLAVVVALPYPHG